MLGKAETSVLTAAWCAFGHRKPFFFKLEICLLIVEYAS